MIRQGPWASAPCHRSLGDSWARTPHWEILRLGQAQDQALPPISPWSFWPLWGQGVMLITYRQMRKTDSGAGSYPEATQLLNAPSKACVCAARGQGITQTALSRRGPEAPAELGGVGSLLGQVGADSTAWVKSGSWPGLSTK